MNIEHSDRPPRQSREGTDCLLARLIELATADHEVGADALPSPARGESQVPGGRISIRISNSYTGSDIAEIVDCI